jgi:hypothetical protein
VFGEAHINMGKQQHCLQRENSQQAKHPSPWYNADVGTYRSGRSTDSKHTAVKHSKRGNFKATMRKIRFENTTYNMLFLKMYKARSGGVAQEIQRLPSKHKAVFKPQYW